MSKNGLKLKYNVTKIDTGEPVGDCFVLRPTKDPAALQALIAYAIFTENKDLAQDISDWVREIELERE